MSLHLILVVLHIVFAAAWFAAPLALTSMLRSALPHGREAFGSVAKVATRFGIVGAIGNAGTIALGIALIFVRGGFASVPPTYHAALTLAVIGAGLGLGIQKPAGSSLVEDAQREDWNAEQATATIEKLSRGVAIQHALWLTILVLMYWK